MYNRVEVEFACKTPAQQQQPKSCPAASSGGSCSTTNTKPTNNNTHSAIPWCDHTHRPTAEMPLGAQAPALAGHVRHFNIAAISSSSSSSNTLKPPSFDHNGRHTSACGDSATPARRTTHHAVEFMTPLLPLLLLLLPLLPLLRLLPGVTAAFESLLLQSAIARVLVQPVRCCAASITGRRKVPWGRLTSLGTT
jgi:hypothetical protein